VSLKWLDKLIERAKKLEEQGRRIAFERDRAISDIDLDWLRSISKTVSEAKWLLGDFLAEDEWADWAYFLVAVEEAAEKLGTAVEERKAKGIARKDLKVEEDCKELMRDVDWYYHKATGKWRCTWLLDVVEPYTLSVAVNDLTACFHRAIEKLEEVRGGWRIEGKCAWRE